MLYILYTIMEAYLLFGAMMYTSNIKINLKRMLLFIPIVILPGIVVFQLLGQWYGIGYFLISVFTLFYWMSKRFITFIHICFVIILGIIMDHLTQIILNLLEVNTSNFVLVGHIVLFPILFISVIVIYKKTTSKMFHLVGSVKAATLIILVVGLFTMSTFYSNILLIEHLSHEKFVQANLFSQLIYFGFMVFILMLTIRTIKKENEMKQIQFETAQFKNYIHSLELINNDMQTFQHDYSNILFTLQGYIENDDLEGLKTYFNKHIVSAEATTLQLNKRLANLSNLQITGLKGVVLTKILQAEKEGITVNIEIPDTIEVIDMNVVDLARIIGIFFDNAIEANRHTDNKKEIIFALLSSSTQSTIIVVENTYYDEYMKVDELFKKGYSTKGEHRGIGLGNVKRILANYPNATLQTGIHNGLFSQMIEIVKDRD